MFPKGGELKAWSSLSQTQKENIEVRWPRVLPKSFHENRVSLLLAAFLAPLSHI